MKTESAGLARVGRRRFLAGAGAFVGASVVAPSFDADPFTLGVASGDPAPDGVVIWTRLAPDPLNGGGIAPRPVEVGWEVASDERMKKVIKRGTARATPELAHAVHVEVAGLEPARWYYYRFRAGAAESPVGRTRTAPAANVGVERLNFAFASCQHYEQGFYTAYRHLAAEDLDLVVHLGDYIYEGGPWPGRPRIHNGPEVMTLADYRNRYALYKGDPDLQRAHALFPWVVTWDDHEVDNNYANEVAEDGAPREAFRRRRADAYQAYYEHLPLRRSSLPRGPGMQLYRRVGFGGLAEFNVLDTRQYRTDQPCGDGTKPLCPEALDPKGTIMGVEQERWLLEGLGRSRARWNVIAQQVMIAPFDAAAGPERRYSMDKWSGYPGSRDRLINFLRDRRPANPVVITGDIHSNWAADLKADFDRPESAAVGTEFVGTSISSGGDGADMRPDVERQLAENAHIKFFNGQRGYVRCRLTPQRWQTDYRVVAAVTTPGAAVSTRATFVVEDGKPGAERG